jgi:hypothetical protein
MIASLLGEVGPLCPADGNTGTNSRARNRNSVDRCWRRDSQFISDNILMTPPGWTVIISQQLLKSANPVM